MEIFAGQLMTRDNLVFAAAAIQAAALLFQGQIRIRVLLLIGSAVYLIYYMTVASEPLWQAAIATSAMALANIYGLTARLLGNTERLIPANQMRLFGMLRGVEPAEFRAFMKLAKIRTIETDLTLTKIGMVPSHLFFIIDGTIEIEQGAGSFKIPPEHFIGEISLMLGTPASATVIVRSGAQVVAWPREKLIRNMARRPRLKTSVESLLGRDMARKVAVSAGRVDPRFANEDVA